VVRVMQCFVIWKSCETMDSFLNQESGQSSNIPSQDVSETFRPPLLLNVDCVGQPTGLISNMRDQLSPSLSNQIFILRAAFK